MKTQRLIGIVLLAAGLILLFLATDASTSLYDRVADVGAGHFAERIAWVFAGGMASALLGSLLVLASASGKARRA